MICDKDDLTPIKEEPKNAGRVLPEPAHLPHQLLGQLVHQFLGDLAGWVGGAHHLKAAHVGYAKDYFPSVVVWREHEGAADLDAVFKDIGLQFVGLWVALFFALVGHSACGQALGYAL